MREHRQFFGDAERTFELTAAVIPELERKTGVGIGTLVQRLMNRTGAYADLKETIRLALVGGGSDPAEAAALVETYVDNRPIGDAWLLAFDIVEALYFGPPAPVADLNLSSAGEPQE